MAFTIRSLGAFQKMARDYYGYGRWEAPYWFIGPEHGQKREEGNDLTRRQEAWEKLGCHQVCDCRQFHEAIDQQDWHRDGRLQPTWRRLILLLMAYLGRPKDREEIRAYQRDQWGSLHGETCVIELLGLAANNFAVSRDRESFVSERMQTIIEKIRTNRPKFVVMYGKRQREKWKQIAGYNLDICEVVMCNGTALVMAAHPVSRGMTDSYWSSLGANLRKHTSPCGV